MALSKKIFMTSVCACLVSSTSIGLPLWFCNSEAQAQSRRVNYVPPSNLDSPLTSAAGAKRSSNRFIALTPQLSIDIPPIPQTVSERPTIYLRIPKFRGSVTFKLYKYIDATSVKEVKVYEKKFNINNDEGIIAFKLPDDAPVLEVGQVYKWHMSFSALLLLNPEFAMIEGSVRRIPLSTKLIATLSKSSKTIDQASVLAQEGIWFDTLQVLAEAQATIPANAEAREAWVEILKSAFKEETQKNIQDLVLNANFVLQKSSAPYSNY